MSSEHSTFDALGLSPHALAAVARMGFTQPTPIQTKAIPPALAGRDVIGCAATGTGKTAAFGLPMLERLSGKPGTRALVLAPTRELAEQIAQQLGELGHGRNLHVVTIIGGASMPAQVQILRREPLVIIATPGRLVDHLQQRTVDLSKIEMLVLDEADRMLDMGFRPQLNRILAKVPKVRQTLLFSATLDTQVASLVSTAGVRDPVRVEVTTSGTTAARAEQAVYFAEQPEKLALLLTLLESQPGSTLVFTRTKRRADRVAKGLARAGHSTTRIHADRSQGQRRNALEGFRKGEFRVLVATDIAARGLDVEEIGHVVNFDLPHVPEDYVHRVGRTARAAASGYASSFVAKEERELLQAIERFTRKEIPRKEVDRSSAIFTREMTRSAAGAAHPGPKSASHGVSGRPQGQAPGRHARTHGKNRPGQRSGAGRESRSP